MDCHILTQAIVYVCICIFGLFVSIGVGVNKSSFDGECILYADVHLSYQAVYVTGSASLTCDFPIYFGVFGMTIFGLAAGACYMFFAMISKKDEEIGFRMCVLPAIVINAVLACITLIVACMITVGFNTFCDRIIGLDKAITSCGCLENSKFNDHMNTGAFVSWSSRSQDGAWVGFFLYLLQTGLCVFRYMRNRKHVY